MISYNTQNKLPKVFLPYSLIIPIIASAVLVYAGIHIFSGGDIHGTQTINGVASPTSFSGTIPGIIFILVGLIIPIRTILYYFLFSFTPTEEAVTINSGVFIQQSKTIEYNKIQNVDSVRGILLMLFGITKVNLWTASQGQVSVTTIKNGTTVRSIPDGVLYLLNEDVSDFSTRVTAKGSVQDARVIAQAPTQQTVA